MKATTFNFFCSFSSFSFIVTDGYLCIDRTTSGNPFWDDSNDDSVSFCTVFSQCASAHWYITTERDLDTSIWTSSLGLLQSSICVPEQNMCMTETVQKNLIAVKREITIRLSFCNALLMHMSALVMQGCGWKIRYTITKSENKKTKQWRFFTPCFHFG